ncbi:unnamed protein product [Lactuca saligna]|uniref:Protein kinase domain-containing protein n=1 Tax=Lactuca saligna TaxID=75948 RepID=A0AA35VBL2_LACSI|nr:unnamed protein product [Lactuca saligna]
MSSSRANLAKFLIPLEEIHLATQNFSSETLTGYGNVYRGELSERWQNRTAAFKRLKPLTSHQGEHHFLKELEMISSYNHENIIPFIGYCDEGKEMIIVSEYAINGSLAHHLHDPDKSSCLTWVQRLKICIGAARALEYLHSRLGESRHRNIKASNILLDDNMEAKVCDFGLSLLVDQKHQYVCDFALGANLYLDPVYKESGIVMRESDVYSFGVVMFEMLSGMLAYQRKSIGDNQQQTLINLVRRYYDDGLDILIDPQIRDQINSRSFHVFKEIAYQCISWNLKDRPTMDKIIKSIEESLDIQNNEANSVINPTQSYQHQNLENFLIPLKEIILVTENFSPQKCIGESGFTRVYKVQLSECWQNQTAAIKRFAQDNRQAEHEFHNELQMISSFHHQNIISFIGYCDESNEMVIVYEYATNGSLDNHLEDPQRSCCITWAHRLKICIGVARGLEYLHSGLGEDHIVIHRDIKSGNILLDDNMEAKICDFGLSLLVSRNRPQVYDAPAGTRYYMDPIYEESGIVKTESDVYSFGVVLLEILSGKPAYYRRTIGGDNQPQTMIHLVRRYYEDGLDILIDPAIRDEINIHSFRAFMKIVYRCISLNIKDRPTVKRIINRIEEARDIQLTMVVLVVCELVLELCHLTSPIPSRSPRRRTTTATTTCNFKIDPLTAAKPQIEASLCSPYPYDYNPANLTISSSTEETRCRKLTLISKRLLQPQLPLHSPNRYHLSTPLSINEKPMPSNSTSYRQKSLARESYSHRKISKSGHVVENETNLMMEKETLAKHNEIPTKAQLRLRWDNRSDEGRSSIEEGRNSV